MVQTTSHIFSGKVDIESNLLVGSSHLFVDTVNNRVGITTANPDASLHVNGNAYVESDVGVGSDIFLDGDTGIITATEFRGDGSNLVGVLTSLQNATDQGAESNVTIELTNDETSLIASGNVTVAGNVTASTFVGDGSQLTGIATNLQAITDNGNVTSNTVQFTNTGTSLTASGTIEATAVQVNGLDVALDRDMTSNAARVATLETDMSLLTPRVTDLEAANAVQEALINDLRTDVTSNTSRISSLETDRTSNTLRISLLESANIVQESLINDLRTDLTSNTARIVDLEAANTVQETLINDLRTDVTSNTGRIATLETDLSDNASRITTLETANTIQGSLINLLRTDVTSNAARVSVLETDLTDNVSRIETLETANTVQASLISTLESANAVQAGLITNLTNDLSSNDGRITTLETANGVQAALITNLTNDLSSNDSRITTLEAANAVQQGLITELQTANGVQATLITNLTNDLSSNDGRITVLEAANTVQQGLITELQTANGVQATLITNLTNDLSSNDGRITVLEAANTVQQGLITELQTANGVQATLITNLTTDLASNDGRITALEAANTVQQGLITELQTANGVQATLITNLTTDLSSNDGRITALEAANTVQQGLITELQTANGVQATLITNLTTDLASNDSRITALETTTGGGTLTLQGITDLGNTTTNVIQFSNVTTGLVTTANVEVGGDVKISGLTAGKLPYVAADQFLKDSFITTTADATLIASNLDVTGNIFMRGERFTVESESKLINDAIIGIANNNTIASTDIGILMQRPSTNVALIHHGGTDKFTIGYTLDDLEATDITNDTANIINVNILGNLYVQNVVTASSFLGDGTALTGVALGTDLTSAVTRITNLEAANTVQEGLITELQTANGVQATLITNLTTDLASNDSRITTLEAANTVQQGLITDLQTANGVQATLITNLTTDLASNDSRITTLEAANTVQQGLITDLQTANGVQAALITNLTTDLASNDSRITTLEAANTVQQGLITELQTANGVQATLITNLTTDLSSNDARITTLEAANTVQQGLITELQTSNTNIWSNLADNSYRIGTIENELAYPNFTTLTLDGIANKGNTTSNVLKLTNATTGLVADGNVHALKFIGDGSGLSGIAATLQEVSDNGNVTSNTVQFTNGVTSLTASGNVLVTGNVTAEFFAGDGSNLTGIATTLQAVSDNGNVTSNTIQFTNVTTGFITTSNIEIGGNAVIASGLDVGNVATGTTASLQTITQNYNNLTNVPASSRASGQWRTYTFGNITLPNDWTSTGFELRATVNGTLDGIATAEYVSITMKKQGSGTQPSVGLNFNPQNQSSGITSGGGKVYYTNVSQSSTTVSNGSFSAGDVVDFYMSIYVTYWNSLTVNFEIDYNNTVSSYSSAFVVNSATSNVGILTNEPAFNLDVHGNANVGPLTVSNTLSLSNVATMGTTKTFVVTVSGGVYYMDGVQQPSLELHENQTYIFDMSDSTNSGHPLAFSTAYNGATSSYTTGVVSNHSTVASGTSGSKVTWTVPAGAPSAFYYYCTVHGAGMGSSTASSISPTAELIVSGRVVASGNVEADAFIGDGSQLTGISGATTSDLQVVTTNGATSTQAIQLTNTGTSLAASGAVTAASVSATGGITAATFTGDGSSVNISAMTAGTIPYVDANKRLRDSHITRTADTTVITSNLQVDGNLFVTGETYAVNSENMVINDRIIGLANNNTSTTLDVGLILQYPQKNVAMIHHGTTSGSPHNGQLTLGYTQSDFEVDNITKDPSNNLTLNVWGHVVTQNNITVGSQGSYYGDGTTLTGVALSADLTNNVTRIEDLETATIISNSSTITTGFTKGDIIYASADNVLNKLAIGGTDGYVLKVTSAANKTLGWAAESGGGGGSGSTVWQQNGSDIYYSAGDVGINTSTPAFDLDVHGTANVGALTATSLSVGGQTLALASDLTANATRLDAIYNGSIGDIIYVNGANSLTKLGIGSSGQVLKVSAGGVPEWANESGGGGGGGTSQWTTVNANEIYYDGPVGIANTDPGHDLSVGSNLYVDDDGSNVLVVTGNTAMSTLTLGEVSIVASYSLDQVVNTGNVTANTVQFSNAITSLTAASNVVVTGNVTAAYFMGDGSNLTGISSTLQAITDSGNVTSNTVQFSNAITGLVTTANVEVGGELTVSGNVEVGTSNLFVDTVNSRVGIGVTSPQTNFHVESSGSTGIDVYGGDTGHPSIFIGEHMTNYSRKWGGKFTYYGDSNIRWLNVSVVDDNVETPALTIRRNAHIGINEESPETTLHITNETETTGTGDAFIPGLTGNTSNRKPTECLRLQGKWYSSGSGALLRFTNQHPQGTFPNTGEYNLAGIAGYDHDSSWGGGLAFYTSPGTGTGGDDLTLRMSIDSVGAVNIPGPTTGASHGSASMLYLLDTPVIKEWQWTGSTNNTLRVTFSASELPTGCKAIYADVFMPQHSLNDHVGHALGKNHGQQTMWTGARNQQPSTAFGNLALQQCFLSMPGQSDGFEFFYGNWWNSCIIPLDTGNKLYHTVSGESGGTQSWIYMVVKGYFH